MKNLLRFLAPLALATTIFVVCVAVNYWGGTTLAILRVRAAEFLMIQPGGPRLGARPVADDIVLVLFDTPTAAKLGYVRSYTDDAQVYRRLSDAGAAVVYDTRNAAVTTPEDFALLQPLLELMLELNGDNVPTAIAAGDQPADQSDEGSTKTISQVASSASTDEPSIRNPRMLRDLWIYSKMDGMDTGRFAPIAANNPVAMHPHAVTTARVRMYPIAYIDSFGNRESAPIAIARHLWGQRPADSTNVAHELMRCGILTEWHRQYPDTTVANSEPQSPYRIGDHQVPWYPFLSTSVLVLPGAFWVSFDPDVSRYQRVSYLDVLQSTTQPSLDFRGKTVIVGYSLDVDPGSEIYEVPSGFGKCCAAEMVAVATQTVLDNHWMKNPTKWLQYLVLGIACLLAALVSNWLKPLPGLLATLGLIGLYCASAIIAYWNGWWFDFLMPPVALAACGVLGGTHNAWRSHRVHRRVVDLFGRYVPRAVVNQMMLQTELKSLQLGGTKREVTVLFADIRGFTTFSESLDPEQVVKELNSLLRVMVECTFEYEGTLDKFIGDAILVLFNAPLDQQDHVNRAIRTALEMQARLINHSSQLSIGIGVHSGAAVVGNIGTPQRMEYTAIGNTVNIASRLCDAAKSGTVLVSQQVAQAMSNEFTAQPLEPIKVKGINEPIQICSVSRSTQPASQST